jgi:hypothetical protein
MSAPPCAKETPMPDERSNEELMEVIVEALLHHDPTDYPTMSAAADDLHELARRLAQAERLKDRYERALNDIDFYNRGHPAAGQIARRALRDGDAEQSRLEWLGDA